MRQKASNPSKNNNFVGRVRDLKVFVGNFTYECNFMVLEVTTSIIDHHLGEVVFGKPFVRKTGFVYDQEEGTVIFEKDNEKITFKMPHKMEMFNHIDFKDVNTDFIPPFVFENNDDRGKTYYSDSLTLGPEYREDESISKEIRHLMKLERDAKRNKGEVTKFLIKNEEEIFTMRGDGVGIKPDGVASPTMIPIKDVNTGSTKVDSGIASKRGQREEKAPMNGRRGSFIITTKEKKRKAQVQFEAQYYTEEDWDAIRAKLEANAELTKDVLGKDLPKQDFAKRMVDMVNQRKKHFAEKRAKAKRNKPMTQSQLRIYMSNYLKNQGTWKLSQLKKLKFEEIKEEFDKLVRQIDTFVPINLEAI
ncbi:protein kinase-like domain, concanavalin A-like lectin/glucanase domain protein [Tanacetum coccineum]